VLPIVKTDGSAKRDRQGIITIYVNVSVSEHSFYSLIITTDHDGFSTTYVENSRKFNTLRSNTPFDFLNVL